ncbi:MAG: hypothetical protein GX539_10965 [Candidatus Cloacimonetes bacterium]|nr:hypothetical protein [Candidatus Cloacimonadota bacterium]
MNVETWHDEAGKAAYESMKDRLEPHPDPWAGLSEEQREAWRDVARAVLLNGKIEFRPSPELAEIDTQRENEALRKMALDAINDRADALEAAHRNLADYRTVQAQLDVLRGHLANGDASDGHHTHKELYRYRMLYNAHAALAFNAAGWNVVRSFKHADGRECFGGGWFVVHAETPAGQVTNHYISKYWHHFDGITAVEQAPAWDGHTPEIAALRLEASIESLRQRFAQQANHDDLLRRSYARAIRERDMQATPGATRHYNALTGVVGAASQLVQQWAEVSDDGRDHLVANLAKSLRNLESVEAKLGIAIEE